MLLQGPHRPLANWTTVHILKHWGNRMFRQPSPPFNSILIMEVRNCVSYNNCNHRVLMALQVAQAILNVVLHVSSEVHANSQEQRQESGRMGDIRAHC